jgi:hypothetical protein
MDSSWREKRDLSRGSEKAVWSLESGVLSKGERGGKSLLFVTIDPRSWSLKKKSADREIGVPRERRGLGRHF